MKHLSKVSLFQRLLGIAFHTMKANNSPRLITYSYRMLLGLLLFLVSNHLSAQSGTFSWSTSGVGNAWAVSDNTKTYNITYTEGGVTKTVTVTMTIIDPNNRNYDLDVYTTHPFDTGGGCLPYPGSTETDNITGNGTITDPWDSDCGSIFTETEGAYGTGYLTFAIKTLNSAEDVTIRYTFSKPIFLDNYTVGDIDYVGLAYSNSVNQYEAPGNSYQDEVSFTASGIGGNVPIDIVAGANLTKTGQTVKATYNTSTTGDVDPNLAANTATLSTAKAITSFDVAYSNGPEDASAEQNNPSLYSWWSVTAGKGATNGVSDDHAIRISGFTFTVCPTFVYPSINATICAGQSATVTATPSNGTAPYTYSWSTGSTAASITVNPAATTQYLVTVTDANGCAETTTAQVTVNPLPNANAGLDKTLTCTTTSVTLNGSSTTSGVSYSWTTTGGNIVSGATTASPVVNAAGTYILTVRNTTTNCTATDAVVVTLDNTAPNANAGLDKTLTCTTTSVTLNGSSTTSGVNYSWTTTGGNIVSGATTASPVVNAAGTYILTVTNPTTGCTATDNAIVTLNNTPPNVNAGADKTLTCTTTSVTLNGSSTTSGATYAWTTTGGNIVSGATTASPVINAAGTYVLTVTNPATGCTATDNVVVTLDNTAPNVNAGADKTLTCTTTSVTLNGSSTTSGVTYAWTTTGGNIVSGATTASPVVNAAGTYILTVTNPATGCTATDNAIVTLNNTAPNVNAGLDKTLTCTTTSVTLNGSSTTSGVTYAWTTTGGNIVSGATTASPVVNAAGTYILTVTNPTTGCTATDNAVVTLNNTPPIADAGLDKTINCTTTSVTIGSDGIYPNATYSWSPSTGLSSSSSALPTATPTVTTTYTLTITDNVTGCTATDAVVVTIDKTPPTASITGTNNLTCVVTSVTRTALGGGSYSWAGPSSFTGTTASVSLTTAGTYTVTVTSANGCTATATTVVTLDNTAPNVNAGADKTLTCVTTSVTLNGSSTTSGATYAWTTTGGNIVSGATTASPVVNASGTYVLTVTNPATGCTATDNVVVITDSNLPNVNAGLDKTLTCTTTSVTLNGSSTTSGVTYAWTTTGGNIVSGATTASPVVNAAGTYILTVTNPATGCTATDNAIVTLNNTAPNVNAGLDKTLTCTTTSVTLNGSSTTSGATYAWTTTGGNIVSGATTASPVVNAAGTYVLTVTNPTTGCTATDNVVVTLDNAAPNVNAGLDKTLTCTTTSVTLNGSSTTSGATYAWTTTGGNIVSGATTASPIVNAAGTYVLTVTNPTTGCTATDNVVVSLDNTAPNINAGLDKTLTCTTTSVTLNGSSTTSGATYSWTTTGGNIVSGATTASPVVNASGTYVLTVTNPATGCTATDNVVVITDSNLPNVNAGLDKTLTCTTTSVTLNGSSTTSGATYAWTTTGGNIVSGAATASPVVNAAGTYILTVTNPATGCTATDNVVVTLDNTAPNVNAGTDKTLTCITTSVTLNGSSTTSAATYSWTTTGGNIVSGATTASPIVNAAGTYVLTVTNPTTGCTATDNVVITLDNTAPNVNAGLDKTLTCTTTSVTLNGSSTTSGATYSWTTTGGNIVSGATTASPVVSAVGTYVLTVTNPATGCTATDNVVVTLDNTAPNVNAGLDKTLTCTTTSVTLNGSSTTSGATYSWTTTGGNIVSGATTASPVVNASGTYVLTVTNPATGCTATDNVVVITDSNLPNVNAGLDKTLTCTTTSVTLNGSSTTSGATYVWTTTGGNIVSSATTASPVVNAAGTYVLTVTNPATGCTATDNVVVTLNNTPPVADAGLDKTINCTTTSVTIGSDGIYPNATYSWSPSTGLSSSSSALPTATPTTTTTYTLTITDNVTGCTATDAVVVTVDKTPPTASITGTNNLTCVVTSVTRTAVGGGSYSWAGGPSSFTGTTASVSLTTAGTYTVTVTSVNGCTATATTVVTLDNTAPNVNAGADKTLTCTTTSVTLNGSSTTSGATYAWTTTGGNIVSGATTASPVVNAAGTYILTVTNPATGCTATDNVVVTLDNTAPNVNAGTDKTLTCTTTSVTLNGSSTTSGATYAWTTTGGNIVSGATTASPVVNAAGTYVLTVTNPSTGCTATDNVVVTLNNTPLVADAGLYKTINCTTTSVTIGSDGIYPNATYSWSPSTGLSSSSSALPTATPTVTTTYTLTITDNVTGCTATDAVVVTVDKTPPTASITGTENLTCSVTSVNRTATGGGTYLWAGPSSFTGTTASVSLTTAGIYTVTVTSVNGCTATATTVVTLDNTAPNVNAGADKTLTCTTISVTLNGSSTTSGATYAWTTTGGNIVSGATTASPVVNASGTYILTVTNPATGCTATDNVVVITDSNLPNVNAGLDKTLTCTTTSVTLNGSSTTSGATYVWTTTGGNIVSGGTTASPVVNAAGTYVLTVTNPATGCTATDNVVVTLNNTPPVADAGLDKTINCTTTSVTIGSDGIYPNATYSWSPSTGLSSSSSALPTATPTVTTTYTLTITDNVTGCTATDAVVVTVDKTPPTASITGTENLTCSVTSVNRTATGGGTYSWAGPSSFTGTTASVSLTTAGTYTVTVTSANGCTATATTVVTSDSTVPQPTTASAERCGEGTLTLSATGCTGTYNWYSSSTSNVSLTTTAAFTTPVLSTTTVYYVSCTVGSCTSSRSSVTAEINPIPSNIIAGSNSAVKEGNPINLTATSTNGTSYSWAGPNGFTSTVQNPVISGSTELMEGVYTVTVSSPKGCTATATTNVIVFNLSNLPECTEQAQPTVSASSNSPIISGGTINLSSVATGAIDYAWTGPNGFTSSLQSPSITNSTPTMAGIYTVAVTVDGVCKVTATTNVIIKCLENPLASSNTPICVGNALNLSASGGNSYSWTGPNNFTSTQQNPTISNAQATAQGVYTVTLTGVNCTTTVTTNVVVNPLPNPEAGIDKVINCTTSSVQIGSDAVIPNATYLWSPSTGLSATNSSIVTATPTTTTTYILTVTNNQTGCTATDAVVVTVDKSALNADAGIDKTINCTTTLVELGSDAVIPNATYLWSPSAGLNATNGSVATATPTTTTTYILTVTNNLTGCTATDAVVVTVDKSAPNADAGIDKTINCTTTSVEIGSDAVIPNVTYLWSPSVGLNATNGSVATATPTTTTTYILTVTNNLTGCTATDAVVVTVDKTAPTASITGNDNLTCTTSSVTRVASGGGTYLWSNNLGTSATATISAAGTYTVTVTSANGCTATATTSVTVDTGVPTVTITATEDTLTCLKTQSVLTASITPAGTYTYLWSNGSTASSINVNDAGTYSVEVTALNGCKASASVLIREFNTVTAQVDVKDVDCKGRNNGSITVTGFDGIAPYKFKLNTGAFQSNNVFAGLTAGTYAVAIQDAGGCTASINVTVKEPLTSVALTVTPTNLKCNGATDGQIQATATGGTPSYTFAINGGTAQSNGLFTNLVAGTYTITATDTKGCSATATTEITQPTKLAITAVGSMIDCSTPKGTITATVTGGTPAYQYSIDGTNFQPSNSFANLNGGTYTITVKDLNLCVGTVTAAITVADTVKPTFTSVTATMATCTAGTANNDGKLTITGVVNGVKYQYSAGNTFNASTAVPAVAAAIPSNGVLTNTLTNPTANSQMYTIRIFNNNGCYKDVTVELLKRVCDCKTDICVPVLINKTKTRSK